MERTAIFQKSFIHICLIAVLSFVAYTPLHAQLLDSGGVSPGTSALVAHITLSPSYPLPGDTVTATVHNHQVYKPTARVTWVHDGKVVQEEVGVFSYEFTAGKIGTMINLSVSIAPKEGSALRANLRQEIGSVRIVWEGKTYTPPFYRGRALASSGSEIVLQALPLLSDGKGGYKKAKDIVFSWRINGETNPSRVGIGLESIIIPRQDGLGSTRVSVQVGESSRKDPLAMGSVLVPSTQPQVYFYTHDAVMGINAHPIGNRTELKGASATIYAEPFYTSVLSRTSEWLRYEWTIGNQELISPGSIILQPEGSGSGTTPLELVLTNTEIWQQRMQAETMVQFESNTQSESAETIAL